MAQADIAAFKELQDKLKMNVAFAENVAQQLGRARVTARRAELTLEELSQMSADVPMYKQVGKAYFMAPMPEVVSELRDDIKASQDEVKRFAQQREHADKAIAEAEKELRELMKAHPEAIKQLMAMG
ncbi:pfdn1 [Scenedesmus sp. PABB004]|nr:pfdn1 [Scenedesmus sp. PABB004]